MPKISVVLPIYNAGCYLYDSILSIKRQCITDFECLLCDASTDGSSDYLADFVKTDTRFILLKQPGFSLPESLQVGLEQARAPFVARMDADDISLPQRFSLQMNAMERDLDLVLLGTSYQYIDEYGERGLVQKLPKHITISEDLLWECPICHSSVMFRKEMALNSGGYRRDFQRAEDYDLWLRLSSYGKIENLEDVLVLYRMYGTNSVTKHAIENRDFAMKAHALYLLEDRSKKGESLIKEPTETLLAKLNTKDSLSIKARMLACSAHLIGDKHEDPLTDNIYSEIKKALPDKTLSKALSIFHMRCAKRYAKYSITRAIFHGIQACRFDIYVVYSMLKKVFTQHIHKIIHNIFNI